MNILIPHTWLLDHLETTAKPAEIQRLLSLSGPSVERIYEKEGEAVYDIEVTTNRVDMMSVRGIAREAAVILQQAGLAAKLKDLQYPKLKSAQSDTKSAQLPAVFNKPELNTRTMFLLLKNVSKESTPEWMARRLRQIDLNVHDARIDITNYITHDLGHPCHAFDYDKLMATGGEIHIQEAQPGEEFTTLDGENYKTVGGEVVFKNGKNEIIDLPSIKGTENTSVDESTQHILLLMESIRADKVRFASMTHAIRTTAAQLMEKNVDPYLMDDVMAAGAKLYQELCGAAIGSEIFDDFLGRESLPAVTTPLARVADYLGITIPPKDISRMLTQLGCSVKLTEELITVTPPSFRPDITIAADVIEEIARIYGYHNLPSTLMDTAIPVTRPTHTNFQLENRVKHFLATLGWQELYTYSMVSAELAVQSGHALGDQLKLQNPLTEDRVYLRRSLIPSLQEVLEQNSHEPGLSVFEIAHVYHPVAEHLPQQVLELALLSPLSYREVRGVLEALFAQFYVTGLQVEETAAQGVFSQQGNLLLDSESIGTIGILKSGATAAYINFEQLIQHAHTHPAYQPIPKTAPLFEDYTFTLPESAAVGQVLQTMQQAHPLVAKVQLASVYKRNHSFTVTYWDSENSLSSERIEPARTALISSVKAVHQGSLVGA